MMISFAGFGDEFPACCGISLDAQQGLDGAALVHRPVAFGDVGEWQLQVEHLAGIDLALKHEVDQVRRKRRTGAGMTHGWCVSWRIGVPHSPDTIFTIQAAARPRPRLPCWSRRYAFANDPPQRNDKRAMAWN